jgi:hypothetical protein
VGTAPVTSLSRPCSGESCRTILRIQKKQIVYARGAKCDALFYIQKGKKIIVVSQAGMGGLVSSRTLLRDFGDYFEHVRRIFRSAVLPKFRGFAQK